MVIPPTLRNEVLRTLHSECHRLNHAPVRSYSGRAYPPPFRRPGIDVTRATKQHRHRLRLLQRRLTRRRLRLSQVLRTSAIMADAITSSLVTVCRVGWASTKRPRVHHTPELLDSLPVFARCSPLSASLKFPQVMEALPRPPISCRDGGVRDSISSVAFLQSNGRAEVAVKKAKRTRMDTICPTGSLDNDGLLRAMLQLRNTPDPDCNVSPAEVIFGRSIRDAFSFVNRCTKFENPSIRPMSRDAWSAKENAMRARFARTSETLNADLRALPQLMIGARVYVQISA